MIEDLTRAAVATVVAFLYIALPVCAQERKVALVMGNSAYHHVSRLANTVNDAQDIAASLKRIGFGSLENAQGVRIVLLDACRNNPFVANMVRSVASRSIGRGLSRIDPGGVLVGYAARGGTIALDGEGRNSPYTGASGLSRTTGT